MENKSERIEERTRIEHNGRVYLVTEDDQGFLVECPGGGYFKVRFGYDRSVKPLDPRIKIKPSGKRWLRDASRVVSKIEAERRQSA